MVVKKDDELYLVGGINDYNGMLFENLDQVNNSLQNGTISKNDVIMKIKLLDVCRLDFKPKLIPIENSNGVDDGGDND